ncbi:MAG: FHA domain-containing protein [Pseudomonadales bacterium]|nr:FHA domain-containing protein [Pseudomonadales bacterium]
MLKLQHRGTTRSVWLVGPTMKVGAAKNCDLVVLGEGVGELHCILHVKDSGISVEPQANLLTLINDKSIKTPTALKLSDVLKIGQREFDVINPRQASSAGNSKLAADLVKQGDVSKASGWMLQGIHHNIQNKRFPIDGKMVLGRSKDCDLHFSFERLSRRHAQLSIIDGNLLVEDLDSSNGTFHNGKRIKRATLSPGDTLALDKLEFTVLGKKESKDNAETVRWDNSLNQTVVRSAITPEMIEKAAGEKKQQALADVSAAKMIQPGSDVGKSSSAVVITALVIVVAGLIAAALLI